MSENLSAVMGAHLEQQKKHAKLLETLCLNIQGFTNKQSELIQCFTRTNEKMFKQGELLLSHLGEIQREQEHIRGSKTK